MDNKKKKRQFRNSTPGQSRDYEELSAHRMFKAYEDVPANHTGSAIANWDPPLGKETKVTYRKKRRELDMETLKAELKVDGRTKSYRETVRRIKERQEKMKEREAKSNNEVNPLALQAANPFGNEVDEIHSPKDRAATDAAVAAWKKAGGKMKKLKPGQPKGMPKSRKAVVKMRKETVEMNKKYLKTRDGSIEDAVLTSLTTETPVNPNSFKPTLTLPKNRYLNNKEGSLEQAVVEALTTEKAGVGAATAGPKPGYKLPRQMKNPKKEKMVGTPTGTKVVDKKDPKYKNAPEHESHDVENMIQFGKPFTVGEKKEVDVPDTRRTVDAIRAYDRSKDASRDADWDTVHGKIKQGKKEKKYAKKERGEIDKDDPNWKHRSYHTGMHGEETEMTPMIRATIDKIHSMREDKLSYKERQKLPKGDFALPGKGDGPEGKQGGSYPIPDESHARNALARVSQHGTAAEKAKVKAAVERKFPGIKVSESKAAEEGERDVGSDAYANYAAGLTPGQEPDAGIKNKDAKKASSESKKTADEKEHQSTRIDDEYLPSLEEFAAHLETLEGEALDEALDGLDQNQLLEILGTGLVKKAAGAVKKRFSAQGRADAAKKKGAKIAAKTAMVTQKTANIGAKKKLKAAKAAHKAAKGPGIGSKIAGAAKKAIGAKPAGGNVDTRKAPGRLAAEYDPEIVEKLLAIDYKQFGFETQRDLIEYASTYYNLDELSKQTLGSYVKKASASAARQPKKMQKRQKGIGKAVDKLTSPKVWSPHD